MELYHCVEYQVWLGRLVSIILLLNSLMAGRVNLITCMCADVFLSYPNRSYRVAQNDPRLAIDVTNPNVTCGIWM